MFDYYSHNNFERKAKKDRKAGLTKEQAKKRNKSKLVKKLKRSSKRK